MALNDLRRKGQTNEEISAALHGRGASYDGLGAALVEMKP